ncbi:hypothetical protein DFH29DRAFT_1072384 [Suillus ampliporus]|nr:hypothetical protein DFH29DRAFT_1072384 [Suillus ampliporus]
MLWNEAFLDTQKAIELNSLPHLGYNLKHAALHGAQHYDEAIQAFRIMLSQLDNAPDTQTRKLRHQYVRPSEADRTIRKVIDAQLDNAPLRVLDTTTGLLCDREAQINAWLSVHGAVISSNCLTLQTIRRGWKICPRQSLRHTIRSAGLLEKSIRLIKSLTCEHCDSRQRDGEFKRIASDHDIIEQVRDLVSVDDVMDIRTLEIL